MNKARIDCFFVFTVQHYRGCVAGEKVAAKRSMLPLAPRFVGNENIATLHDDFSKVARLRNGGHPVRDGQRFPWIHRRELLWTHGKHWVISDPTLSLPLITFCLSEVYFGAPTSHRSVSRTYVVSRFHSYRERRQDTQFWTNVASLSPL